MYGVLIVEALAQTGAVAIVLQAGKSGENALFQQVRSAALNESATHIKSCETRIIGKKAPSGIGEAIATVDGELAVKAELTFMVGLQTKVRI